MISTNIDTVVKLVISFLWVNFEVERSFPIRTFEMSKQSFFGSRTASFFIIGDFIGDFEDFVVANIFFEAAKDQYGHFRW